jgi:hypothetical protein
MAARKLDMGAAWSDAVGSIGKNRDTVSAIVGLFFFLPYLTVGLLAPETSTAAAEIAPGTSPDDAMRITLDQMSELYAENWPILLGVTIMQFIGSLSLLALLGNTDSPTVGEALRRGIAAAPSYFAAQFLSAVLVAFVVGIPLGLVAFLAPGLAVAVAVLVLLALVVYFLVKFALIAPVIAIESERNPIKALRRSWSLTKGNSFRIAVFMALLLVTLVIVTGLFSIVLGLVFALFDKTIADIGNALVASVVNALIAVVFLVVLAAIHRQLAGPSSQQLASTFE